MIAHAVLFRPRVDLSPAARTALPGRWKQRCTRSRRSDGYASGGVHGRAYETLILVDYQYAAVLEFDDAAGLLASARCSGQL